MGSASQLLRRFEMPHAFVLLLAVIFGCSLLSYVIPSGTYQREERVIDGHTRHLIAPGTYQVHEKSSSLQQAFSLELSQSNGRPTTLLDFLDAVPRGLSESADIIFFCFFTGGVFGVLNATGVISATIGALIRHFGHVSWLLSTLIVCILAIGGSTIGLEEETIPLIPAFVALALRLGYDRIYALALVFLSSAIGFAAATTNPFTVLVAQNIAEVAPYSGLTLRLCFFVAAVITLLAYLFRYGASIHGKEDRSKHEDEIHEPFTWRHACIHLNCLCIFSLILYGSMAHGWTLYEMSGGFLMMGMLASVIGGLSPSDGSKAFAKGIEEIAIAAVVIGVARGIEVVLRDAQILDTIIYSVASLLERASSITAVQGMLLFQSALNFFIPSGSGQASVTMPLMAPLSDLIGVSRQTSVLAFQFGDGLSKILIPTSGTLIAALNMAQVPYGKWVRFAFPLFLMLMGWASFFLIIACWIEY